MPIGTCRGGLRSAKGQEESVKQDPFRALRLSRLEVCSSESNLPLDRVTFGSRESFRE